jgi:hypothetical protein
MVTKFKNDFELEVVNNQEFVSLPQKDGMDGFYACVLKK